MNAIRTMEYFTSRLLLKEKRKKDSYVCGSSMPNHQKNLQEKSSCLQTIFLVRCLTNFIITFSKNLEKKRTNDCFAS